MSLKILIFYFFSSIFFLTNNLFASHVTVVDGDTIKLGDIKIRFSGIDAPEINQICVASEGKVACGKISRDILITKVTNNKISCTDEGKDFYGRVLGECFVNGESLSSYLVREGFAESKLLLEGIQDYSYHQVLSPTEFFHGDWEFLRQPLKAPRKSEKLDKSGSEAIAKAVVEYL